MTGLKPQGLSDSLFRKCGGKLVSPSAYVATLQTYLKQVHDKVRTQLEGELSKRQQAQSRTALANRKAYAIGDHVLLRRPPAAMRSELGVEQSVSTRFLPLSSPKVFEIYKLVGEEAVVLCDPDTKQMVIKFA